MRLTCTDHRIIEILGLRPSNSLPVSYYDIHVRLMQTTTYHKLRLGMVKRGDDVECIMAHVTYYMENDWVCIDTAWVELKLTREF